MELVIGKKQLKKWLSALGGRFKVVDVRKSVLPAKKYLFPPLEAIFWQERGRSKLESAKYSKELLVFGLDLAGLKALAYLDEIMRTPQEDFFYWQRRNKAVIIGLSEETVGAVSGGDLILEKIDDKRYRALAVTKKGEKLLQRKFFKPIAGTKLQRRSAPDKTELDKLLSDPELLSKAVAWSVDERIWDELAEKCLGCGICTYVCPLCHCFSTEDSIALDNQKRVRCRYWDACTLPGFAKVAGGHNFHRTLKERYYNWFYHKFVRAYKEYGRAQCVGCRECEKQCPAGISIERVLIEIVRNYQRSKHS